MIAGGTINNSDLKGPLLGKNISDLITLIQSKNIYVNVHTQSHPDGEIRGQIVNSDKPGAGAATTNSTNSTVGFSTLTE